MPPRWRSSQAVDARIFIGQDDDATSRTDTRTFWGPEPITGKARFYSKKPLTGLRCRIIVQGSVKTRTIDDASQSMSSNANHEAHTFLSHVLCECENIHLRTEIELPFTFNLQHLPRASYLTTTSTLSQQLLPSLDSKNAQRHWSDAFKSGSTAYYEITYTLIASAHVENKLISSTTKMFHYVPTLTSPPTSFPVEDFPEDYTLRVNKILQSQPGGTPLHLSSSSSSSSRLGIITQEPPPVIITPHHHHHQIRQGPASTTIEILLMLARRRRKVLPPFSSSSSMEQRNLRNTPPPLPNTFTIKAKLRTLTFIMREPALPVMHAIRPIHRGIERHRHRKDDNDDDIAIIRQEKIDGQVYTGKLEGWKKLGSKEEDEEEEDESEESEDESKVSSSSSSSSFSKPSKPSNSGEEEEEEISTHSLKIPFFLHPHQHHNNHHSKHKQSPQQPLSSLVIPDFWSPLLSRRHVIDLEISLACNDDKNNPNYEVTKLRIPLQVCYGEVH